MLIQQKRQLIIKIVVAVISSTALGTVLLLGFPLLYMFLVIFVVFGGSMILRIDPVEYSYVFLPILYFLGGIIVFVPGIILNIILLHKSTLTNKIISVAIYLAAIVIIAILLSPYIQYQLNHQSLKV